MTTTAKTVKGKSDLSKSSAPRKKPKLPPHQYSLRLDNPNHPPQIIEKNLPHIVYHEGKFMLFRNKWKSRFRYKEPWLAACLEAPNITNLQFILKRAYDKHSFGYYLRPSNRPR